MQIINHLRSIKKLSKTDILTGISSRRYLYALLNQEWRKAITEQNSVGFMIIDINNFEAYNAQYGHLRGDTVLKELAHLIDKKLADTPYKVGRWGGEEFAILLPQTGINEVENLAKELSGLIHEYEFVKDGISSKVEVSIGINALTPDNDGTHTLDSFISNTTTAVEGSKVLQGVKILSAI